MFVVRLTDACWENEIETFGPYSFDEAFKVQTSINEMIMKAGVDFYVELVQCAKFDKNLVERALDAALDD